MFGVLVLVSLQQPFQSNTVCIYIYENFFFLVLWEIWEDGKHPYPQFSNTEVMQKVNEGYRLPKPESCPERVYELMMRCWNKEPEARPNFKELFSDLNGLLDPYRKQAIQEKKDMSMQIRQSDNEILYNDGSSGENVGGTGFYAVSKDGSKEV